MREDLDRLLRDVTLTSLALAIALGWSLYQLAHGIGTFVDGLFIHLPAGEGSAFSAPIPGDALTWVVGRRVVTLDGALVGIIELALTLAAGLYLWRRRADPA